MSTALKLRTVIGRPLTNIEVDDNFTGLQSDTSSLSLEFNNTRDAIYDILPTKAPLSNPVFTGFVEVPTYTATSRGSYAASLDYITSRFQSMDVDLIPSIGASSVIINGELVYQGINLGSASKPFANIWVQSGKFAANTISIGTADISASESGGVLLPSRTSIGVSSNIIPTNLISSALDIKFAQTSGQTPLIINLIADTEINEVTPVGITPNGLVARIKENIIDNSAYIGFSTQTVSSGQTVGVVVSGPLEGFSDLIPGIEYYLSLNGTLETTVSNSNIRIGVAKTTTTLFIYSNSSLDIYGITHNKIEYSDLFIGSNNSPLGEGGITYDNTSGEFKFTPPLVTTLNDLNLTGIPTAPTAPINTSTTQIATTGFVITQATLLAPKNSPIFTGIPTAPTAATGTSTGQLATTAFVTNEIANTASTDSPNFTGIPTAPTAAAGTNTTQIATTAFVIANGGGLNIDGGMAATIRNTSTISLNGGGA